MTDTPEDWVLIEAAKRAGIHLTPAQYRAGLIAKAARPYFLALCDMIAKHEQPPVDRKLLCAREAAARAKDVTPQAARNYTKGLYDQWDAVQLGLRTIELYLEGFGE